MSTKAAILPAHSFLSDAEAGQVIATSPEPIWIKDPHGRVIWGHGIESRPVLSEAEERTLRTGTPELIDGLDEQGDWCGIVLRATVAGLPVLVGYSVHI